ncbi:MAG TPA: hypothetical protein VIO11_01015 [Candidatus Methanoperedens sp.]
MSNYNLKIYCKIGLSKLKKILPNYGKVIEYSVAILLLLNILDIASTYIGIRYFNAYEANEMTAYFFNLFGMQIASGMKILVVVLFCLTIKILWKHSEILLAKKNYLINSIAIISSLNAIFIMILLNIIYVFILLNNIQVIYTNN